MLLIGASFNGRTPVSKTGNAGSIPSAPAKSITAASFNGSPALREERGPKPVTRVRLVPLLESSGVPSAPAKRCHGEIPECLGQR